MAVFLVNLGEIHGSIPSELRGDIHGSIPRELRGDLWQYS